MQINRKLTNYKKYNIPSINIVNKVLSQVCLSSFIKQAWKIVEPACKYVTNWHIDCISDHLQAASSGEIKRLLINLPPRHMKSLMVSVFWPCWVWINKAHVRWLFSSYSQELSTRDNVKCRRLIQSIWYQSNWKDKFKLTSDQNQKTRFENDKTGYRIATSVEGLLTGEGGDICCVDDPHNVKQTDSQLKRESVLVWWDEVMSTRLNNPKTGVKVIVMQRIHERDLSGHVLESGDSSGYEHLCLPARYEGNKIKTSIGFIDPRTNIDEPLWKDRFGDKELSQLEKDLGEYATSSQLQQRPAPRGGGIFKTNSFQLVSSFKLKDAKYTVRYWDKAGTKNAGCFTAGVLMHRMVDDTFMIEDVVRGQWEAPERERKIKETASLDGESVSIWIEQEPGSGGKESAENTILNLAGFCVYSDRVTGSKEVRAEPYSVQVEGGNVSLLNKSWTRDFIKEHESFPVGKYKDMVDASAGAFNKLIFSGGVTIRVLE